MTTTKQTSDTFITAKYVYEDKFFVVAYGKETSDPTPRWQAWPTHDRSNH
jgi:hypothetical protein